MHIFASNLNFIVTLFDEIYIRFIHFIFQGCNPDDERYRTEFPCKRDYNW